MTLTAQKTRATPGAAAVGGSDADRRVGRVLGGYRLTGLLGGGGMGLVYEAERVEGEGPARAAVKVLSPAFADDPDFVARFRREADALIRLRHPHLIEVYEKGEHSPPEGGPTDYFFVMERFEGEDLRRYVASRQLGVETILAIVRQAAAGLAYAHENGVVHRDIKPGNILVRGDPATDGLVKVVDFGVAQLASPGHTLTSLTRSDLILGTFNYMSPEQRVDSSRIDHRADVYALGVVAYELLTGSLPLGAFEAPSELRPELPKSTDRALLAALRRDPEQRPATVEQFAQALEIATRPVRRGRWLYGLAAAATVAAGVTWGVSQLDVDRGAKVTEAKAKLTKAPPPTPDPAPQAPPPPEPEPAPTTMPPEDVAELSDLLQADAALVRQRSAALAPKKAAPTTSRKRKMPSPKKTSAKALDPDLKKAE